MAAFSARRAWAAFVVGVRAYAPREDGNVMLGTAAVGRDPRISAHVYRCIYPQHYSRLQAYELLCTLYGFTFEYLQTRLSISNSSLASFSLPPRLPYPLCARFFK